jgi:glutamine synthetase
MSILAEYIWIDGTEPDRQLRSKTKVLSGGVIATSDTYDSVLDIPIDVFPAWGADGSSTNQAEGADSDIGLEPVAAVRDPFRPGHYLVLCEVNDAEGNSHGTNARADLRKVLDAGAAGEEAQFGFEQEYTFLDDSGDPLGFPHNGYPAPQGPYYCAVGTKNIFGRDVYEDFLDACMESGIQITGANWEVMPGQAEVQVFGSALVGPDHLWLSRYILHRVAEDSGVVISLDPKPASGDWNGAGMHTNFSTQTMREPGGIKAINAACEAIGEQVESHLAVYGSGYERRLTGDHETCSFQEFRYGVADRTASIRIPRHVASDGCGYLEDRRPNANADPYAIAARMLRTVCGID